MAITRFTDFESKPDSINRDCVSFTDALNSNENFRNKKQTHLIVSFNLILVDTNGKLIFDKAYCG